MSLKIVTSINEIPEMQWNALSGDNPFLSHAYLSALQASECASPNTGWHTQFLTLWHDEKLAGALPLYFKTHSYGEFVFDWAWADAYQQHGLRYYPKLVSSVPFTPVAGSRVLANSAAVRQQLIQGALKMAQESGASSLHILFPEENQALEMKQEGMMLRRGFQLHWRNPGYDNFDDYLSAMRRDKRKKINQERRKIQEAGISFEHIRGENITSEQWDFFMRCYTHTHQQFNSPQPLNRDFFNRISTSMPQNILLIFAIRDGNPIAGALNFYKSDTLYGRSWGAIEYHPALHFETCYYQAIEFCITNKITLFEGGAQGEHKLARGFLPTTTWSAHWLAHPEFSNAVEDFLQREAGGVDQYIEELNDSSPFKKQSQNS